MIQTIFANLPAMLFTLALGAALLGMLIWLLSAQGAASMRGAYVLWGLAVVLVLVALFRMLSAP